MGKGRRSRAEGWAHTLCSKADHSNSRTVRAAGRHTQTWHCVQGGDGLCCRGLCTRDKLCKVSKPRSCPLPPISPLPAPIPRDAGVLLVSPHTPLPCRTHTGPEVRCHPGSTATTAQQRAQEKMGF